jgi:phosphoribosylpyrophosphate synthetase
MNQVVGEIRKPIQEIIDEYVIDAVAFVPHSVPRVLPFLTVIRQSLALELPEIQLEKIYQGEVRVAQKSLSKLEERVENAYKTIFLSETGNYKRVLLIDDAVGSGATFNEVAKKLKKEQGVEFVAGFAAVGSYKGFEVIQEV